MIALINFANNRVRRMAQVSQSKELAENKKAVGWSEFRCSSGVGRRPGRDCRQRSGSWRGRQPLRPPLSDVG